MEEFILMNEAQNSRDKINMRYIGGLKDNSFHVGKIILIPDGKNRVTLSLKDEPERRIDLIIGVRSENVSDSKPLGYLAISGDYRLDLRYISPESPFILTSSTFTNNITIVLEGDQYNSVILEYANVSNLLRYILAINNYYIIYKDTLPYVICKYNGGVCSICETVPSDENIKSLRLILIN